MTKMQPDDPLNLMRLHVEALFTHDADGRLVRVNEPGGGPAPRFFLGRTPEGTLLRFRQDVSDDVRAELEAASRVEPLRADGEGAASAASRYAEILARSAPVQRAWTGPAYAFPSELPPARDVIPVTDANARMLQPLLAPWLPDVATCRPMLALAVGGEAVAVCCSVRRTAEAHEAGVETAPAHRGRSHAAPVVAAWARAVRELGCVPLYSTSWENSASRAVARKLGLHHFGSDLHVT